MTTQQSQKRAIKSHLISGGSITPIEALNKYGCLRLAARISELRSDGMHIKTVLTRSRSNPHKKYATYSLNGGTEAVTPLPDPPTMNITVVPKKSVGIISWLKNIFK